MSKLHKYINLLVKMGVNINSGDKLLIWCPVEVAYFARMVMEEAYKAGAKDVLVHWEDELSDKIICEFAPDSKFDNNPEWISIQNKYWIDNNYKMLWIYATDPNLSNGIDQVRMQKISREMPRLRWTVASVPIASWAVTVFPNAKSQDEAVNLMWEAIFKACHIDENNPLDNWEGHIDNLLNKAEILTEYNLKHLHFKNKLGTDLIVELPKEHAWLSCVSKNDKGKKIISNIPTEEIFTSPLRTGVNGTVHSTKPLVFMGEIINDFWLEFKAGKVVKHGAAKNEYLLKSLLESDENASYLGEVALVPNSSPISKSGLIWYDSSFDENASCHLAFGQAYPQTLKDYMNKKQKFKEELNQSIIHQDFMIGSDDMNIIGVTQTGNEIQIFACGEWMI